MLNIGGQHVERARKQIRNFIKYFLETSDLNFPKIRFTDF